MIRNHIPNIMDFVQVYSNHVPLDKCEELVDFYKNKDAWYWSKIGSKETGREDLSIRKVKEFYISHWAKEGGKFAEYDAMVYHYVTDAVTKYVDFLVEQDLKVPKITSDEGYVMLNYKKGYSFSEHVDASSSPRTLSCILNLSDQHKGGRFTFFNGAVSIKLLAGDALIFPSSFNYPHAVTELTEGERYSIVTWLK